MKYVVKQGESLYSIAKALNISVISIFISNPQITNANHIYAGQTINVPRASRNIVNTSNPYTYNVLVSDITQLKDYYPFLKVNVIGKSVLGKNIYEITFGRGSNQVTYNGSHHAVEWITVPLLMKFIENFSKSIVESTQIDGHNPVLIYDSSTIRIIPMVNPDGVNLSINGLTEENRTYHNNLIKWNNGSRDFTRWSANIRGVDINHNYNAGWNISKAQEPGYGIYGPGPTRYSGPFPESEPETKAMVKFTWSHKFRLVIAYHSQGQVIYWDYMNKAPKESLPIARRFASVSGYSVAGIAPGAASVAGYKDWYIDKFSKPGFTVEVGHGTNPLPLSQFSEIYRDNIGIFLLAPMV